jgi:hypothetical protein
VKADLPVTVLLRCKLTAVVQRSADLRPFALQGMTGGCTHDLWTRCGHWREDKSRHPLDIVAVVRTEDGAIQPLTDQFARK